MVTAIGPLAGAWAPVATELASWVGLTERAHAAEAEATLLVAARDWLRERTEQPRNDVHPDRQHAAGRDRGRPPAVSRPARAAWEGLSRSCHRHAYELSPADGEIGALLGRVAELAEAGQSDGRVDDNVGTAVPGGSISSGSARA